MHSLEERELALKCLEIAVPASYTSYDAIELAAQMLAFVLTGEVPNNETGTNE